MQGVKKMKIQRNIVVENIADVVEIMAPLLTCSCWPTFVRQLEVIGEVHFFVLALSAKLLHSTVVLCIFEALFRDTTLAT